MHAVYGFKISYFLLSCIILATFLCQETKQIFFICNSVVEKQTMFYILSPLLPFCRGQSELKNNNAISFSENINPFSTKTIEHLSYPQNRIHTERQQTISGVHSIMMEISAQAGEGGGARLTPFTLLQLPSCTNLVVYAPAERAYKLQLIHLYPYTVCTLWS